MMIFLYIVGGIIGFLVFFFFFGAWRLRRSIHQAAAGIVSVKVDDIPFLAEECVRVFREKLGQDLSLGDFERTAWILDDNLRSRRIKSAFARSDFSWYFVKPLGAFVGELLRHHSGGEWQTQQGRPPHLRRTSMEKLTVRTFPFEKVMKLVARHSQKGDFYAFLKVDDVVPPPADVSKKSD